jgi:flagellar motility protein MotE (MotC chaperone)
MKQNALIPVATVLVGGLSFFLTMFLVLKMANFSGAKLPSAEPMAADDNPSWRFHNPEFEQWVAQVKDERAALASREEQLKEWEQRLQAESREISTVTQSVTKLQKDFDLRVVQFKDDEVANIKKQIKVLSDMSPDGAAAMLDGFSDNDAVKLLFTMKPDVSAPILDAMSKLGAVQSKRAASLTQKLQDVMQAPPTNSLANASR